MNTHELKTAYLTWDVCPCGYSLDNENREEVMRELALDLAEDILHDAHLVETKIALNLAELVADGLELGRFFIVNTCTGEVKDTSQERIAAHWQHCWLTQDNDESVIYTIVVDTDMTCGAKYAHLARAF